ncbi:hypothetical protein LQZ18_03945 [Lachnospiraceae bacterium ZAX-1]
MLVKLPPLAVAKDGTKIADAVKWEARRKEILTLMQEEMYGMTPSPCAVSGKIQKEDLGAYSDKAIERTIELQFSAPNGRYALPVTFVIPKAVKPKAVFINIAFMEKTINGSRYCPNCPIEEIIDDGFAIAIFDYTSVASDDGDYDNGIAAIFPRDEKTGWGKLGMWAYAMSRVADYVKTLDEFIDTPLAAMGFSRLGKTALWCGAQDERFDYVMPFGSSTVGVGFTRQKNKQTMEEV